MGKKKVIEEEPRDRFENSEDIPIITKDRDLTPEEIIEMQNQISDAHNAAEEIKEMHHKKGILKCKCACGRIANVSDEVVEDGLSWSMIIGNEHYLTLSCEECGSSLTLFIDEIHPEHELSEEGNQD